MKKINTLFAILMMAVVPTVQAHAETLSVESAINELNFALTVQWDQKDAGFKSAAINKFMGEVADLQKQGVSKEEIVKALKSKMPDAQMAKDIDTLANVAKAKNLSPAETDKLVMNYMSKTQTSGASYSSTAWVITSVATIALIVLIIVLIANSQPTVVYSSNCGYDYYGNYYCY